MAKYSSQFSDEFLAILFVLDLSPDAGRDDRLSTLILSRDFDWDKLCQLLLRHRVFVPFCSALKKTTEWEFLSSRIQSMLERQSQRLQLRQLSFAGELVKIAGALSSAQVEFLCLKGPVLSQLLYGDATKRHSSDLDILVQPEDFHRALRAVRSLGYALSELKDLESRDQGDAVWTHLYHAHLQRDGLCLELHWRLSRNDRLYGYSFRELYAQRQFVSLAGESLSTLGKDDMLEYLALHGASHCWHRLKWILDGKLLLENRSCAPLLPPCSKPVGLISSIIATLWSPGVNHTKVLPDWRSRLCLRQLVTENEYPGALLHMVRRTLLVQSLYSGVRPKLRYLASLLIWPAAYEAIRLPRPFSFLYSVIGPALWAREQLGLLFGKVRD